MAKRKTLLILFFLLILASISSAEIAIVNNAGGQSQTLRDGNTLTNGVSFYGGEIPGRQSTIQLGGVYFLPFVITVTVTPEVTAPAIVAAPETKPEVQPTKESVAETVVPATEAKGVETTTTSTTTPSTTTTTTSPLITTTRLTTTTIRPALQEAEPAPQIKIWFDKQLYQSNIIGKNYTFIVSKKPHITIHYSIPDPFSLASNYDNYSVTIDEGNPTSQTLIVNNSCVTESISAQDGSKDYRSFNIELMPSIDLTEGEHNIVFTAKSAGTHGRETTAKQQVKVAVKGGQLSIIGEIVTFPSPYSPTKNMEGVTIQYTLSDNADIEVYIFNIGGEIAKRFSCPTGSEGGRVGLNQIKWNGQLDTGGVIGNGIYLGVVVAKRENKRLAKLKVNVFD